MDGNKKSLIVYFSKKGENYTPYGYKDLSIGNTEVVAKYIQQALDCDIFELQTVKDYPNSYNECIRVAKDEQRENALPELRVLPDGIEQYDDIYIGYPNWWGTYPRAVATFLTKFDFSGKRIHPFGTHEGSGLGNSVADLRNALPDAIICEGLAIQGSQADNAQASVLKWLNKEY